MLTLGFDERQTIGQTLGQLCTAVELLLEVCEDMRDQRLLADKATESLQSPMPLPASDNGKPVFDGTLAMLEQLSERKTLPSKAGLRARGLVKRGLMVVEDKRIQAALEIDKEYIEYGYFRAKIGSMSDDAKHIAEQITASQKKRIEASSEQVKIIRQSLNSGDGRRGAAAVASWYEIWNKEGWPPDRTIKELVDVMGEVNRAVCVERRSPMRRPRKSRTIATEQGDGVCG